MSNADHQFVRQRYLQSPRNKLERLPEDELLCAVYEFTSDVQNGGFEQYFSNASKSEILNIVGFLRSIGALDALEILSESMRAAEFSIVNEGTDGESPKSWYDIKHYPELDDFNERFFTTNEKTIELLAKFLRDRSRVSDTEKKF